MEKQLKERIFGAVVIVSLIVIFVPILLNPDQDETEILEDSLALAPNTQSKEVDLGVPEAVMAIQAKAEALKNNVDSVKVAKNSSKDKVIVDFEELVNRIQDSKQNNASSNKSGKAWVVQLATFADAKNAVNLVNDLNGKGYAAYMKSSHGKTKDFTKVLVGPEYDRAKAEELKSVLGSSYKVEGMVIPFVS